MRTSLLTLTIALAATTLYGQDADLFGRLHKNGDGQVGPDEVEGDAKVVFERMLRNADANQDGKLSKEEFTKGSRRPEGERPSGAPEGPAEGARLFDRFDANKDGKLSKDELPERMRENFDRVDADKNGSISIEEFRRAAVASGMLGANPGGPGQVRPEQLVGAVVLKALDADGDGSLSASEIADASKALAKFDKNGDGKIDRDELLAAAPRPEGRPGLPGAAGNAEAFARRLKEADKNGDGKISKEEAPDRLRENFDRLDGNSDGQLDETEIKRFLERLPR
jgi:Ca2+-binding EF-hand superfamily protein